MFKAKAILSKPTGKFNWRRENQKAASKNTKQRHKRTENRPQNMG
jgi:hypothetical protein